MKTLTIKDIAKQCGVGVSTVSRAINNHPDINKETKEKVMRIIEENSYVPNGTARSLKSTKSNIIAVIAKAIDNPFFSKMIAILEKEIQGGKYSYFLQHVDHSEDEIDVAIQLIREKKLKGIVFLGGYFHGREERLNSLTVPFVVSTMAVERLSDDCLGTYVSIDDKKESYNITTHLCQQGHKKVGMLAAFEEDISVGKLRLDGYREALMASGIEPKSEWVVHMNESYEFFSMQSGYKMMKDMIDRKVDVTAIFAVSDSVAIGACKAIHEAGKSIPEDYAVCGFDGITESFYYHPSITTIEQPIKDIAKETIKRLFIMIKTKKKAEAVMVSGLLIERESTTR